jgi:hypothetical protein
MSEQSYASHTRWVPVYHFFLSGLLLVLLVGSVVDVVRSFGRGNGRLDATLLLLLVVACTILYWYCREFPLKAQDRAIRAEENLRHFVLTGSPLDPRLTLPQVIALRFAADEEVVELARRAAEEGMSADQIKQAVKRWRADEHRV